MDFLRFAIANVKYNVDALFQLPNAIEVRNEVVMPL
jgi:hypothetical protein